MSGKKIINAVKYKVQDGDSIESIAKSHNITWQELAKFNWGTEKPSEINVHLRNDIGCTKRTTDGFNYIFTSKDDPGIIYLPEEIPAKSYTTNSEHIITVIPIVKKSFISADCIVNFRPDAHWNGEYGFDWMREADFPILIGSKSIFNSMKFHGIMGYYMVRNKGFWVSVKVFFYKIFKYFGMKDPIEWQIQPDPNANSGDRPFSTDDKLFEKLENEYIKSEIELSKIGSKHHKNYYSSYMNLYLDEDKHKLPREITLQAFIEVINPPEELYLKYDHEIIEISPESLPKSTQKITLNFKCKKELTNNKEIEARSIFRDEAGISHDILVGKLILLINAKNSNKILKILLVKVKTPSLSPIGEMAGDPEKNITFTEKILHQALITPDLSRITLDFTTSDIVKKEFIKNYNQNGQLLSYGLVNKKYVDLYCEEKLKSLDSNFGTKYADHLIAFFFGLNSAEGLNGYSLGNNVVLFATAIESTCVHEWMHSLGLPHTFYGKGKYSYEYTKTENIMDYTHHLALDPTTQHYKMGRICLYHWQWKIVHS
jgi:hypothetical protein